MKKLIYLLVVAFLFSSCDNFLTTENLTQKNSSNFPLNETDATQMITAIYATMNIAVQKGVNKTYFYVAQLASDDCYGGGGENDKDAQATDHLMINTPSIFGDFWSARYQGINRANMALANLDNVADETIRNQKKGEALFLRAYFYFELTQMFENVPLISAAPENVAQAQTAPVQMPADSIYAHIASDLKKAVEIMPATKWVANSSTYGAATRWAAEALLARVYLFYTGFYQKDALPLVDGTKLAKDFVVTGLNDCIQNSGHSLAPDFRSLWPYTNTATSKNSTYQVGAPTWLKDGSNPEQLFTLNFSYQSTWNGDKLGFANEYALFFGIRDGSTDYGLTGTYPIGQGWGQGPVAANLWNDWSTEEPTDIRRGASVYQVKSDFPKGRDSQMEETGLWQSKIVATRAIVGANNLPSFCSTTDYYGDGTTSHFQVSHAQNLNLIRFADVLLMHSELTGTADGLNKVRARAGLSDIAYSLDALKKERRHELAFEGLRWGDIRRWHDAETALAKQVGETIWNKGQETTMKDQGTGYVARYKATRGFFPIPKTEIDLSNGALKQNPGWDDASANFSSWSN